MLKMMLISKLDKFQGLKFLTLFCIQFQLLNVNGFNIQSSSLCNANQLYKDPNFIEPFFEIYESKDIRISMPKFNSSIVSFEFHGNINELISIGEDGTINGNKYENYSEYWGHLYVYLKNINLKINDKINYWYELKFDDGSKKMYQSKQPFIVQYKIQVEPNFNYYSGITTTSTEYSENEIPKIHHYHHAPPPPPPTSSFDLPKTSCECNSQKMDNLQKEINALKQEISEVQHELHSVLEDLDSLKQSMITQHPSNDQSNDDTTLLAVSNKPFPFKNAIEEIKYIIAEKVQLPLYATRIVGAKYSSCGILFEMQTNSDKKIVWRKAIENLVDYHVKIIEPHSHCLEEFENA